jgi:hypothetical protein
MDLRNTVLDAVRTRFFKTGKVWMWDDGQISSLQETMLKTKQRNISPFCLTVDKARRDSLQAASATL